jgi:flagellin
MSLRINTNMSALNALRNVERASDGFGRSIEKLASGLRINRGADDPAGLIRSEDLRAQIAGLEQAIANSQDATNLIKTAEGALEEVHNLLRSMRQLAVASGNTGTNDQTALQANQNQIRSAIESINRIAAQTQFGTKKLLDGTAGLSAVVTDARRIGGMFFGGSVVGTDSTASTIVREYALGSGVIEIDVTTAAERAAVDGTRGYADAGAIIETSGTVVINGVSFSVQAGTTTLQSFVDQINSQSSVTGVVAELFADNNNTYVRLRSTEYGANFSINLNDQQEILLDGATSASATGVNAVARVTLRTIDGGQVFVTFTGGVSRGDSGLRLTDAKGNVILLNEAGNAAGAAAVGRTNKGQLEFQIGANAGQVARFSINNMRADKLGTGVVAGKSLKDVDVTKTGGAEEALKIIDAAIQQVSKLRGDMGAFQKNVLESNMRSLAVAKENLTATESAIRDTNFAEEISRFTQVPDSPAGGYVGVGAGELRAASRAAAHPISLLSANRVH